MELDKSSVSLIDIALELPSAIISVRHMPAGQLAMLAFYTFGSLACSYAGTNSWNVAIPVAIGFFIAHAHGQAQPSTLVEKK